MIQLTNEWIEEGERRGREEGERLGIEKGERLGIEKGERLGIEKGERLGIEKGESLEAQNLLLRLGRKRLGSPNSLVVDQLSSISDRERLEELCERLFEVKSWQELLES